MKCKDRSQANHADSRHRHSEEDHSLGDRSDKIGEKLLHLKDVMSLKRFLLTCTCAFFPGN